MCLPVLHSIEGFLIGDVIHEDEAHGTSIVGCSDGSVSLLSRRVLGKRQDQRGPTCKLLIVEMSSEIVQSSPLEAQRGVGVCPEAQGQGELGFRSSYRVQYYSLIHRYTCSGHCPVPHPTVGTGDTAVNKMDKNHCSCATGSSVQEIDNKREKKIHNEKRNVSYVGGQ